MIANGTWVETDFFVFLWDDDGGSARYREELEVLEKEILRTGIAKLYFSANKLEFCLPQRTPAGNWKGARQRALPRVRVDGFLIPTYFVGHFLLNFSSERDGWLPFAWGESLHYWRQAELFALELLARGRVAPRFSVPVLLWQPVLSLADDARRFQYLADAMPPVCLAGVDELGGVNLDAKQRLLNFLIQVTDGAVRNVMHESLPDAFRRLRQKQDSMTADMSWLRSLLVLSPWTFPIQESEWSSISSKLDHWLQRAEGDLAQTSLDGKADVLDVQAMRLCLRLQEPLAEGAKWQLEFLLQARDDPSLLFTAEQVWRGDVLASGFRVERGQEILLRELGRVYRLMPELGESLKTARPSGVALDTEAAFAFLTNTSRVLAPLGIGLILPAWWTQKGRRRLSVKLKVKTSKAGAKGAAHSRFGLDQLLEFDARAVIGDEEIDLAELEYLVQQKMPLIQVRGEWMEVRPDELEQVVRFLRKGGSGASTLGSLLRTGAEKAGTNEIPNVAVTDIEWPKSMRALFGVATKGESERGVSDERELPHGLRAELRPYQQRGFEWLSTMGEMGFGVCLADDMGLGKTLQTLAVLLDRKWCQQDALPVLILCPTSLVTNWQRESARFTPDLRVMVHYGSARLQGDEFHQAARAADVVVTTYPLLVRDEVTLTAVRWGVVVLDEAQNIKNSESKQARTAYRLQAERRVALTGTPVENRLSELWSLYHFLNPGYLGTHSEFHTRFAVPIEREKDANRTSVLHSLVAPFLLRRLKTDPRIIHDLPDKIEMKQFCALTREQVSLYEATVQDMIAQIEQADGIQRRGLVLSSLTKLKQICNHPAHYLQDGSAWEGRSGKLQRLFELYEDIREAGEAVLVFTQYVEMGEILARALAETFGEMPLFLHGSVKKTARDAMVERFQAPDGPRAFILSLKAGGVGLTLTRANHVIHFDRWWNPAVENQATDRAFRIGQKKNVKVHKMICQGTLEDRIDQLIESKKELAEQVVATGETWLTEMPTGELRELFALRSDVFAEEVVL